MHVTKNLYTDRHSITYLFTKTASIINGQYLPPSSVFTSYRNEIVLSTFPSSGFFGSVLIPNQLIKSISLEF